MTAAEAQAAIDRRAAVAGIAGAELGELPLLWLIREALARYNDLLEGLRELATHGLGPGRAKANPVALLTADGRVLLLTPDNGSQILMVLDESEEYAHSHAMPNAALVLHDAVKGDPIAAEQALTRIEAATVAGWSS